jgi:crossover junction endodeoxyribonuclease RuvC
LIIIGVDPGLKSGAWGAITHHGNFAGCGDIPHDETRILGKEFKNVLLKMIDGRDFEIITEDVHSRPGQGLGSTYRFGRAVGAIEAVARDLPGTWHIVSPQRWKRDMGLTSDKEVCRNVAINLFPEAKQNLDKKKHHNRAEALLLAEWLRRQHGT